MTRYLLDTNIVSALISDRQRGRIREQVARVGPAQVVTSVIVSAEIRYGIARKRSDKLRKAADDVLNTMEILAFERPADEVYADIRADLEQRGVTISGNDLLIAAQSLALGTVLVTHNTREFMRVKDLRIEDWLTA